ncbi:hypothetical protein HPP92_016025 [Vanilla planifolia]|uniref:Leucine-rich repeat-containing N-terminal plant-type domain-containing protein n=1 Tax=Vanilla planifolia TaxID=51239 RepID=A0A835QTA3_VANPL|nr:hypothetical protein HPP92_016025 [Vanilla planifolia]
MNLERRVEGWNKHIRRILGRPWGFLIGPELTTAQSCISLVNKIQKIFLSADRFNAGIKPAVNVLSAFTSWTESDPYCCNWKGVGCDPFFPVSGLFMINDSSLVGEIPAAVGDLANVFVVEFYNLPGLTGSIPSSLATLRRLLLLNLHHNSLSGSIPSMPFLRYLNLSFNSFEFGRLGNESDCPGYEPQQDHGIHPGSGEPDAWSNEA